MRNLRMNIFLIAGLLFMAVSVSALTFIKTNKAETAPPVLETTWYFDGTEEQILNPELWRTSGSPAVDCASLGNSPCAISVSATDQEELEEYFSDKSASQITAMSSQKRP